MFLGNEGGCSLFAPDEIRQQYLTWVRDKMTEESRSSGVPLAIENVRGASGIVFRGATSEEYRKPSSGGSVSGFQSFNAGQNDDGSNTPLGGKCAYVSYIRIAVFSFHTPPTLVRSPFLHLRHISHPAHSLLHWLHLRRNCCCCLLVDQDSKKQKEGVRRRRRVHA